jgi:hypothetical protein
MDKVGHLISFSLSLLHVQSITLDKRLIFNDECSRFSKGKQKEFLMEKWNKISDNRARG